MSNTYKDYAAALKMAIGKKTTIPCLKGYLITDDSIAATDLDVWAEMCFSSEMTGVVNDAGLQMLISGNPVSESMFNSCKIADTVDFPELSGDFTDAKVVALTKDLFDKIVEASSYVSKDNLRPALTKVWFENGAVSATDGYIAFRAPADLDPALTVQFPITVVKILKKVFKYGDWVLYVSETSCKLGNGSFIIRWNLADCQFPDMKTLLNTVYKFSTRAIIPTKYLTSMLGNNTTISINRSTGAIVGIDYEKRIETGVNATIEDAGEKAFYDTRRVLMPMRGDSGATVSINLGLLRRIAPAGAAIYYNEDFSMLEVEVRK